MRLRTVPPRVVGLREAANILEIRPANVRKMLARRAPVLTELKATPVWWASDVERIKQHFDRTRR